MPEATKVRHLMRGVKGQLFAGLIRDPPRTVADFAKEATGMERSLQERSAQYGRPGSVAASNYCASLPVAGDEALRELVRSVVREELRNLRLDAPPASVAAVADAVREEIRRAVQPPPAPQPEPYASSYNEALRTPQPEPYIMSYSEALRRPAPVPHAFRPAAEQTQGYFPSAELRDPRPVRKADVWRTPNNRPLCYHCGEPGHILRNCPYRRMGLRGFPPSAPRPRYGERPRDIEQYLADNVLPSTPPRRQSRSPSPRRVPPPSHAPSSGQFRGTSPRREN
ncbi:hypothetical protein V5799_016069 [Amblyomma americanum]|uniref:CCHC-type domain-containing protein n=1 Tax=Amblyomma americanum TaxID=6943 RepID=A0AAQ4F668_AMBAM